MKAKHGIVESVGDESITIINDDGVTETHKVHPRSLVSLNNKMVKLVDVAIGDEVWLNGDPPVNSVRAIRRKRK